VERRLLSRQGPKPTHQRVRRALVLCRALRHSRGKLDILQSAGTEQSPSDESSARPVVSSSRSSCIRSSPTRRSSGRRAAPATPPWTRLRSTSQEAPLTRYAARTSSVCSLHSFRQALRTIRRRRAISSDCFRRSRTIRSRSSSDTAARATTSARHSHSSTASVPHGSRSMNRNSASSSRKSFFATSEACTTWAHC
jgi:hypothetical protein